MTFSMLAAGFLAAATAVQVSEMPAASPSARRESPPAIVTPLVTVRAPRPDGHATMRCIVDVTGHLKDYKITSESPAGQGFGAATLKVAHLFNVRPATKDGQPIEASITIPLRWKLSDKTDNIPAPAAIEPTPPSNSVSSNTTAQAPN